MQTQNYLVTLAAVKFNDKCESKINHGIINLRLETKDLVYSRKENEICFCRGRVANNYVRDITSLCFKAMA